MYITSDIFSSKMNLLKNRIGKLLSVCLFFILITEEVHSRLIGESLSVNPYTLPGDSENHHLSVPGFRIHESNDYFGETDKLISGTGSIAAMNIWKHFSSSVSLKGRFFQPILQTRNDQMNLPNKIGVYAETMEMYWNNSIIFHGKKGPGLKLNFGTGYTDAGNHGLVNIYRKIHEVVDSPVNDDKFGKKLNTNFRSTNYGLDLILPLHRRINFLMGGSIFNSVPFRENAFETSLLFNLLGKDYALSLKYMYINQLRSEWWSPDSHRQQVIVALRLFTIWTPSIMYVSPYIKGDRFSQYYLSPISLTYPF